MTLGDKIKFGRKKLGLSKKDFASKLNISLEKMDLIENNQIELNEEEMNNIANILDMNIDYLKGQDLNNISNNCENTSDISQVEKEDINESCEDNEIDNKKRKRNFIIITVVSAVAIASFATFGGIFIQNAINYNNLSNYISSYLPSKNNDIEKSLSGIILKYKDSETIEREYKSIKNYTNNIKANISSDYFTSLSSTVSKYNRTYLNNICNVVNSYQGSKKWDMSTYFNSLCVPKIINGGKFRCKNVLVHFEWTYKSGSFELETTVPKPAGVTSDYISYYRVSYDSNVNKMHFYIIDKRGKQYNYFDVSGLFYDKSIQKLCYNVLYYRNNQNYTYLFV